MSLRRSLVGLITLLLLFSPATAQAAEVIEAADDYTIARQTITVDEPTGGQNEQRLPAGSLEERAERMPQETPREIRARAELAEEIGQRVDEGHQGPDGDTSRAEVRDDVADCRGADAARDYDGLVLHHMFWCSVRAATVTVADCNSSGDCINHGVASFVVTTLGYGASDWREIEFVTELSNFIFEGNVARVLQEPLSVSMTCSTVAGSACIGFSTNGRTDTIANWQSVPSTYHNFHSATPNAIGVDQVSWYDFTGRVSIPGDFFEHTGNGFRCDSASYLLRNDQQGGCVFDLVTETFAELSVTDPDVDQSAAHIEMAQETPELTDPPLNNKSIPGSPESLRPLNRLYHDRDLYNQNRATVAEYCGAIFGDYSQGGLYDCDEYPFASTLQGAATARGHFSIQVIEASDNRAAGGRLGNWYTNQRLLDDDPFYVVV